MVGKTKMSLPGQVGWHIGKANFILQVPDKNCRNQFINSTIIRGSNVFTWPPESSPSVKSPWNKETPAFTWAKTPTNLWGIFNFIRISFTSIGASGPSSKWLTPPWKCCFIPYLDRIGDTRGQGDKQTRFPLDILAIKDQTPHYLGLTCVKNVLMSNVTPGVGSACRAEWPSAPR